MLLPWFGIDRKARDMNLLGAYCLGFVKCTRSPKSEDTVASTFLDAGIGDKSYGSKSSNGRDYDKYFLEKIGIM